MHTYTKILFWLRLHAYAIGLTLCAAALPFLLPASDATQGHFLFKAPARQQTSLASSSRAPARAYGVPRRSSASSRGMTSKAFRQVWETPAASSAPRSRRALTLRQTPSETAGLRAAAGEFPAFGWTVHPVSKVPDWGRMRTPAEWNRSYEDMPEDAFVPVPRYDLVVLTTPMDELTHPIREKDIPLITTKLYYSTRFLGKYDIDAGEYTGFHPGVDLKLAEGTPVGAIAGGRVHVVSRNETLGLHVMVEHRVPDEGVFYSIYGHLGDAAVEEGQDVAPGDLLGHVGMTGNTSGAHLHLQIDRGRGEVRHQQYIPMMVAADGQAGEWTVNPIHFIEDHAR